MAIRSFSTIGSRGYSDRDRERARMRQEQIKLEQAPQTTLPAVNKFGLPKMSLGATSQTAMGYMQENPYTRQLRMRDNIIFEQSDPASQRRMMQNVSRGLPSDIDPQRVFFTGAPPSMPQYNAVLGASGGFGGGWGRVGQPQTGSTKAERDAAAMIGRGGGMVAGGPQPAATTTAQEPTEFSRPPLGVTALNGGATDFSEKINLTLGDTSIPPFGGYTSPLATATPPPFPDQYENVEIFTPYGTASTRRQRR